MAQNHVRDRDTYEVESTPIVQGDVVASAGVRAVACLHTPKKATLLLDARLREGIRTPRAGRFRQGRGHRRRRH